MVQQLIVNLTATAGSHQQAIRGIPNQCSGKIVNLWIALLIRFNELNINFGFFQRTLSVSLITITSLIYLICRSRVIIMRLSQIWCRPDFIFSSYGWANACCSSHSQTPLKATHLQLTYTHKLSSRIDAHDNRFILLQDWNWHTKLTYKHSF